MLIEHHVLLGIKMADSVLQQHLQIDQTLLIVAMSGLLYHTFKTLWLWLLLLTKKILVLRYLQITVSKVE